MSFSARACAAGAGQRPGGVFVPILPLAALPGFETGMRALLARGQKRRLTALKFCETLAPRNGLGASGGGRRCLMQGLVVAAHRAA